jgi:Ni/Fe-hydrogenase subunit HybB-like protein
MTKHHRAEPIDNKFFTPGVFILMIFMAIAALIALYRFAFGLASTTNLTNQYPWGIWIAIDVATGVALAAGGFTTAALAHIFHQQRYEVIVRPALLTALLGYTFVGLGLLVDLGRYYNIWHPAMPSMWQGNSVLFEVGMCVMAYLTILYIEFVPMICERFINRVNFPAALAVLNKPVENVLKFANRFLGKTISLFIIAGVVLSCMHQSSLGALMVIAPSKMHPLWYSPVLALLFLLSAFSVGYPMVVFESLMVSWSLKRKPEMDVLASLSRFIVFLLGIYLIAKVADILIRGAYVYLFEVSTASVMFTIELLIGVLLPLVLLLIEGVRKKPILLFFTCTLIVLGVALNRINVFLVAYKPPYSDKPYFPTLSEIFVTLGLIATLVFIYRLAIKIFPVLPAPPRESHAMQTAGKE